MTEKYDFERNWLIKFSNSLDKIVGEEIRNIIMKGNKKLSSNSDKEEIISWSQQAMEQLETLVDDKEKRKAIMVDCACQYPKANLQSIRKVYEETKDIDLSHQMLLEQFKIFLKNSLKLDDMLIEEVIKRGWGLAGIKKGNTIIATKIPKSANLKKYILETDYEKKKEYYCHCPRIREILKTSETIPVIYCYCGTGFYKGIWEEILQEPVKVELLASVLAGDETCTIAIHLPVSI